MPTVSVRPEDRRHLQEIADILARSKKIVVVTGAGISTSCGIPDFRSENGLYSLIHTHSRSTASSASTSSSRPEAPSHQALPPKLKGRDFFDSVLWKDPLTTSVFYTFIASLRKSIREEVRDTTPTHKFIRTLRDGGRLVRNYSQNIDGLEARLQLCADLSRGKGNRARFTKRVVNKPRPLVPALPGSELDGGCEVVQLHGDLNNLRCTHCQKLFKWEDEEEQKLLAGQAPVCSLCVINDENRRERGKRGTAVGTLRPNIVLYGEEHSSEQILSQIITHDIALAPDVLLILGTSLRVHGLKVLVKEFARSIHARKAGKGKVIFINRTKPSESGWNDMIDWWVGMDCDEWVCDLHGRRNDLWERQGMLQLPVAKRVGDARKEYSRPKIMAMREEEDDKENIPTGRHLDTSVSHLALHTNEQHVRVMGSDKLQRVEKNITSETPEIRRRASAKTPLSTVSAADIRRTEPHVEETPQVAPKTPSKTRKSKFDVEQLPTPPASRRVSSNSKKVSSADEDILLASPSKRKRNSVEIWVDIKDGNHTAEAISQETERHAFPRRMKMVEVSFPATVGSPSKGD